MNLARRFERASDDAKPAASDARFGLHPSLVTRHMVLTYRIQVRTCFGLGRSASRNHSSNLRSELQQSRARSATPARLAPISAAATKIRRCFGPATSTRRDTIPSCASPVNGDPRALRTSRSIESGPRSDTQISRDRSFNVAICFAARCVRAARSTRRLPAIGARRFSRNPRRLSFASSTSMITALGDTVDVQAARELRSANHTMSASGAAARLIARRSSEDNTHASASALGPVPLARNWEPRSQPPLFLVLKTRPISLPTQRRHYSLAPDRRNAVVRPVGIANQIPTCRFVGLDVNTLLRHQSTPLRRGRNQTAIERAFDW